MATSRRRRRWSIEQSKRVALDRLDSIDITCIPTGEDHTRHGYGQGHSIDLASIARLRSATSLAARHGS